MNSSHPSPATAEGERRPDRYPAVSYGEILARDSKVAPEVLFEKNTPILGYSGIPVDRYFDPAFFAREVRHLWSRVWQVACREEEVSAPGDFILYENVGQSLIVARQDDGSLKAFYNSCPHRGRKLATEDGCRHRFVCPYHGMTWNKDGSFHHNPIAFDFPQWRDGAPGLPEARVETWGGWVFVNFDPDAAPLSETLGELPSHFERWVPEERYIALHVSKVVPANWKVTAEAFMESHHTLTTHPQLLPYLSDVNSQYDQVSDLVTRQFSAQLVPSPVAGRDYDENAVLRAMLGVGSRLKSVVGDAEMTLPEGLTARAHVADLMRSTFSAEDGHDYSNASDAEMVDALLYNVFPHMSFWAGAMPTLNYVWRPNGLDPETSLMDIYMLRRVPRDGTRPAPAKCVHIPIDRSFGEMIAETGMSTGLANVFDQDMRNLPHIQSGLKSSGLGQVNVGQYAEMRIRHLHETIDRFLARGEAAGKT